MRSRALQACRPLRASTSLQCLRAPILRSPSFLPPAQIASRSVTTSANSNPNSKPRQRHASSKSIPAQPTRRLPNNLKPASSPVNGDIDPQAAILQPATVDEVDPSLAAEIPTPDNTGAARSSAFTAALTSTGPNGNGNGNGAESQQQSIDWSSSFEGLSTTPFPAETAEVLMQPLVAHDIEIKPDGILYLPEIKYRRILNRAFGPGGWGLAPRGTLVVGEKVVTQEYALVVHGRFIAQARGECQYFSEETIPTAGEGCKSNALMRCCKDLGIASELWDPRFIRSFKKSHCKEIWVEHVVSKKRRQIWIRKDEEPGYPYQAVRKTAAPGS